MDKYEKLKLLGQGSFGKVYLMRNRTDRTLVCCKTISVRNLPAKERDAVKLEVQLMRKLDHPNIVRYHQSVLLRERGTLCIVMEFCDGGDLEGLIKRNAQRRRAPVRGQPHAQLGKGMSEAEYMPLFVQVLLGVEYLHANRVLHRDLKSQNIFLLGNGRLVLGDLGISKVLDGTLDMARTKIGTPYYMAPEIFKDQPYSAKADVWALGCVLFEMITGKHAFEAQSIAELMRKVMAGRHGALPPSHGSAGGAGCLAPPLRALLARMLDVKASGRPTVAQVLRDPAVRGHVLEHFQDMASRPSGKVGSGTADIQQALLDAKRHAAAHGGVAAGAAADGSERAANSLRAQLERIGVDRQAIAEVAGATVGSAAAKVAKAPASAGSVSPASARSSVAPVPPSDARCGGRSPPSQRGGSSAASNAVSRYGHAAAARQHAAAQQQQQQQQQQQHRHAAAQRQPSSRYGQQPQHQLIARQHYVKGALAREEQRRRQVEAALQRLRQERVSLAAAGGRGAGNAYYGAGGAGAGGRHGCMVSPRLQGGVKGVGPRGAAAAVGATPSRLLAKQQAQEQRERAAREARREAEQQSRRREAKALQERRQAQAAQAKAQAQVQAKAEAARKASLQQQQRQQQQQLREMQLEADARFARMLQDQEDKHAAVAAAAAAPSQHAIREQRGCDAPRRVLPTGDGQFVQHRGGAKIGVKENFPANGASGDRVWLKQGRAIATEMDQALAKAAERRFRGHSPSSPAHPPVPGGRDSPSPAAGAEDADDAIRERETELQAELGQSSRICRDLRAELAAARAALGGDAEPQDIGIEA